MSFSAQDLSVLAYANGFTHWHYRTRDPLSLLTHDYFAGAAELLRAGDQITVTLLAAHRSDIALLAVTSLPDGGAPEIALLTCSQAQTQLAGIARAAA